MTGITQKQKDLALLAERKPVISNIFPIIDKEWIAQAMWNVLGNEGAETAGIDDKVKAVYYDPKALRFTPEAEEKIEEIYRKLVKGDYQPQPAKRIYIPKPNGKKRPIGIPTLEDRTVQEVIRMIIEPIYESTFLNCSYGFRPNRRTMDAIAECYQKIRTSTKYYWVMEGDIKRCFDNIDHRILLKLLRKRISDRKLIDTIHGFLKAGYQENGKVYRPEIGTPQGGVISPLLANIYLHELDSWWSKNYDLNRYRRETRRKNNLGNFILIRYADDFIILSNGTKKATEEMRDKIAGFLKDELKLELSKEKTLITHVKDGFDFLGFHVRKYKGTKGVIIQPMETNIQKIRNKIDRILNRRNQEYSVANVIRVLSPIVRGWANYYRNVNSTVTFQDLDFYLKDKFLKWYRGKYRMNRGKGTREGLRWINGSQPINFPRFGETKVERYKWERKTNPYIEMKVKRMRESPFQEVGWYGDSERDADLRMECFKRDNGVCQICQRPKINLIAHDVIPVSKGGKNVLENLITLCEDCHRKYHKELHYEGKSWQELRQLGGSRVHQKAQARFRREEEWKHANESDLPCE